MHVGFGGLGVDLGVDLGAEGGVGSLVGSWWGLGGVFAGALGGEGVADKEEREGRCTSIGLHLQTDLTPSVVNFVRSCLVSCTGAARATREAPATKTKRTKFGVSGENATGMFE